MTSPMTCDALNQRNALRRWAIDERSTGREVDEITMGRPTVMTESVMTEICERLAAGESLRSICREDHMPAISTVLLAVVTDRDGFSEQYMQARQAGGFSHADRVIDVVDRVSMGELDPQSARAMLDGLKWAAERMAPKQHSARQEIDHTTNGESMAPTRIEIVAPTFSNDDSQD